MKKNEVEVTVVIPTHENNEYLDLLLKSLYDNTKEPINILVVLDGRHEPTEELLEEYSDRRNFHYIINKNNRGLTHVINQGVEFSETPWIYLLNDDMVVAPGWDEIFSHKKEDVVVCSQLIEPGVYIPVSGEFFTINYGVDADNFDYETFKEESQEYREEELVTGVNQPMLISKKLFMSVGGWDNRFSSGPFSDIDFYTKLTLTGTKYLRDLNSLVYHFSGKATRVKGEARKTTTDYKNNEQMNAKKYIDKWGFINGDSVGKVPIDKTVRGIKYNG